MIKKRRQLLKETDYNAQKVKTRMEGVVESIKVRV
jgi:hypothetical protein